MVVIFKHLNSGCNMAASSDKKFRTPTPESRGVLGRSLRRSEREQHVRVEAAAFQSLMWPCVLSPAAMVVARWVSHCLPTSLATMAGGGLA